MVSKKSRPIKKVSHESSQAHVVHHRKSKSFWKFSTFVLAILLVASILTRGFSFNELDDAKASINKLMSKDLSTETKDLLQSALTSLDEAGALLEASKIKAGQDYTGDTVKLEFYVMSQCPYGTQVEDAIKPVLDNLGDAVDFSIDFIASDQGDGTFRSLHGQNEVLGNIVQLCAIKYAPDKYMDMIVCMNKNAGGIPNNWEACAEQAKLDTAKIGACYEGAEGKELLLASIKRSEAVNAQGSPTMYINGQLYNGARDTLSFTRALCAQLDNHPACADMPACATNADCKAVEGKIGKCINGNTKDAKCDYVEPSAVNLIYLNDKACVECAQYDGLVSQLQQLFKGLKVTELDYEDEQGKQLYDELDLTYLPVFLFDSSVENGEGYANVANYLEAKGDYFSLRVGASFNPTTEVCNNGVDDRDNDGLIDCADSECSEQIVCREEIPKKIDLFVMSQCPYGVQAMNSMKEVLSNFNNEIDMEIHFIATDNGDGTFSSLHGQNEVAENIRESCVMEYYPENYKYMDYIWCRNKDISSTAWESCATSNGMDVQKIKACAEGEEGKELLREKIKLSNELFISASPSWLVNNKVEFSGLDAQTIKTKFCAENQGLEGCENTLSSTQAVPSGSC